MFNNEIKRKKRLGFLLVGFTITFFAFQNFEQSASLNLKTLPPQNTSASPIGGNGFASTWDGRLIAITTGNPYNNHGRWQICLFSPEKVLTKTLSNGQKQLDFQSGAYPGCANLLTSMESHSINDKNQKSDLQDLNALSLAPAVNDSFSNPYRSRVDGTPDASGIYTTYDFFVFTQAYNSGVVLNARMSQFPVKTFGRMRFRVIISNAETSQAAIVGSTLVEDWQPFKSVSGKFLQGLEPSVTADGRLFVYNLNAPDSIWYTYNANPKSLTGWSEPKSITSLHQETVKIDGLTFKERYPLARKPLVSNLGVPYAPGELIRGAYPWISAEGSDLFLMTAIGFDGAVRASWSTYGEATGGQLRRIDGGFEEAPDQRRAILFTTALAQSSSIWNPFRNLKNPAFPLNNERPASLFLHSNGAEMTEVSFKTFTDGSYITHLSMNRALNKLFPESPIESQYDLTKTPDISGRNNFGSLEEGAYFPVFNYEQKKQERFLGEHIRLKAGSRVNVNFKSTDFNPARFSVEMVIKPTQDLTSRPENAYMVLFILPGTMNIILEKNRMLHVSLESANSGSFRTGFIGPQIPVGEWTHIATTWDQATGRLKVYVNAKKIYDKEIPAYRVNAASGSMVIGPSNYNSALVPDQSDVMAIDEVKVSRVVRSADDFADSAFIPLDQRGLNRTVLNSAIQNQQLRILDSNLSLNEAQLGSLLFKDPMLSKTNSVSCATCHDVNKAFTDGKTFSVGISGKNLNFNTPTLVNRGVGRSQNWQGEFNSVLDHLWAPLAHVDEMGLSSAQIVQKINLNPTYKARFQNIYNRSATAVDVEQAISSFVNANISMKSRYDLFTEGRTDQLSPDEILGKNLFFGKARCAACHNGNHFSDEQFHNTGLLAAQSLNRQSITLRPADAQKFKTPTLRHLSLTAPYFHDGSVSSLEAVVELYNAGAVGNVSKSSEIKKLNLTTAEKAQLVSFLKTLDSSLTFTIPINLNEAVPAWPDQVLTQKVFKPGQLNLRQGQSITIKGFRLTMQTDGNLVVVDTTKNQPVWSIQIAGKACSDTNVCLAAFQTDGNFVLYENSKPYWGSATYPDGDELIFKNTPPYLSVVSKTKVVLWPRSQIEFLPGKLTLSNGADIRTEKALLTMQMDGNLVVYDFPVTKGLWGSGTAGRTCSTSSVCLVAFQGDGNLVMYQNGQPYWATGTQGVGKKLIFKETAPYLQILDALGEVVWSAP